MMILSDLVSLTHGNCHVIVTDSIDDHLDILVNSDDIDYDIDLKRYGNCPVTDLNASLSNYGDTYHGTLFIGIDSSEAR